jgi:hypothetical protein
VEKKLTASIEVTGRKFHCGDMVPVYRQIFRCTPCTKKPVCETTVISRDSYSKYFTCRCDTCLHPTSDGSVTTEC